MTPHPQYRCYNKELIDNILSHLWGLARSNKEEHRHKDAVDCALYVIPQLENSVQVDTPAKSEQEIPGGMPKIITLCGSVKFWDEYRRWNAILTLRGYVVLSCGLSLKSGFEDVLIGCEPHMEMIKQNLDRIHLRKIDLSDEIFVLDVDGYIGESTRSEIDYALKHGKPVRYLSEELRSKQGEP